MPASTWPVILEVSRREAATGALAAFAGTSAAANLAAFTGTSAAANECTAAKTASAATTDNKTFFIEPALFRSIDVQPIHSSITLAKLVPNPGCDRPVAKGHALGLNLHMRRCLAATMPGGKVKTSAIAAFLGNSGPLRQKEWNCGAEVTFRALNPGFVGLKNTPGPSGGKKRQLHPHPIMTAARPQSRGRAAMSGADLGLTPPPSCG